MMDSKDVTKVFEGYEDIKKTACHIIETLGISKSIPGDLYGNIIDVKYCYDKPCGNDGASEDSVAVKVLRLRTGDVVEDRYVLPLGYFSSSDDDFILDWAERCNKQRELDAIDVKEEYDRLTRRFENLE